MCPDLAEDGFDIDGQVSVWTAKPADDAEAESLKAFLQSDAAGPRTSEWGWDESVHH